MPVLLCQTLIQFTICSWLACSCNNGAASLDDELQTAVWLACRQDVLDECINVVWWVQHHTADQHRLEQRLLRAYLQLHRPQQHLRDGTTMQTLMRAGMSQILKSRLPGERSCCPCHCSFLV